MTNETTHTSPRIYVACLASYNAGHLFGRWIDAGQTAEEIAGEVSRLLADSPVPNAEEWAIHDYEGFEGYNLSEYTSFEVVAALAAAIEEHGEAFPLYAEHVGDRFNTAADVEDTVQGFEEAYCGEWRSEEEYAYNLVDELGYLQDASAMIEAYFDYAAFARDLFMGDYFSERASGGMVHVFRSI